MEDASAYREGYSLYFRLYATDVPDEFQVRNVPNGSTTYPDSGIVWKRAYFYDEYADMTRNEWITIEIPMSEFLGDQNKMNIVFATWQSGSGDTAVLDCFYIAEHEI